MTPPTDTLSAPVQSGSMAQTRAVLSFGQPSAQAWAAPTPKTNPLILKKRPAVSSQFDSLAARHLMTGSATPFPAPAQAEAFTVPRPVILEPISPWGQPVEKVDFSALWRTGRAQAGAEFSRPPVRAVRSPEPFGGLNCSPC